VADVVVAIAEEELNMVGNFPFLKLNHSSPFLYSF
jgi:hypothetical protein